MEGERIAYCTTKVEICFALCAQVLPREQCDGIKNFIVQLIIAVSSDAANLQAQHMYLNKLNLVLVQIVKQVCSKISCVVKARAGVDLRGDL